jgi:hypothetical protein
VAGTRSAKIFELFASEKYEQLTEDELKVIALCDPARSFEKAFDILFERARNERRLQF